MTFGALTVRKSTTVIENKQKQIDNDFVLWYSEVV